MCVVCVCVCACVRVCEGGWVGGVGEIDREREREGEEKRESF